ncbi:MAG: hypothetical protein NC541_02450 [bacterium]|nr:hypothetical protein [bacterium]
MDITKFKKFSQKCSRRLPKEIAGILKGAEGKSDCIIGFITTDDFYGFYLTWDYGKSLKEYYAWKNSSNPAFLYRPLVEIVESCPEIDFCNPSDEKWDFAQTLLTVLKGSLKQIPDKVFRKHGFEREDILFFATMGDGDYMQEMTDASVKLFNASETLERYGLGQQSSSSDR